MAEKKKSFTGIKRSRKTHWTVKFSDRAAQVIIATGGIGTIAAVLTVALFLVYVVIPLFLPADILSTQDFDLAEKDTDILRLSSDEYQTLAWTFASDERLRVYRLDTGELYREEVIFPDDSPAMTAAMLSHYANNAAFGFEDGSVRLGTIAFETAFLSDEEDEQALADLAEGEYRPYKGGMVTRTPRGQLRFQELAVALQDPIKGESGTPVRLIDEVERPTGPVYSVLHEDGTLLLNSVRERKNLMTGKVTLTVREGKLPFERHNGELPDYLLLSGLGDSVFLIWKDGRLVRYDTRDVNNPVIAETLDISEHEITALDFQIGRTTLLVGESNGDLSAWFAIRDEQADTSDQKRLVKAHTLKEGGSPVVAFDVSSRSRLLAAGMEDGTVRLLHTTSEKLLTEVSPGGEIEAVGISPRDNGLLSIGNAGLHRWEIDPGHPEITVAALVTPVWYEGYSEPAHVWQSSSGTDKFEPKYGLWPLIFGTLKATVYTMAFAIPLALLAAIYTSEFLQPSIRNQVKPAIELMASLPSVVLGFLAGLVFAPFIERFVAPVIGLFFTIPLSFLFFAYMWQIIPRPKAIRLIPYRLLFVAAALPFGILAAIPVGSVLLNVFFAGDMVRWLDGQVGTGAGGWMLLFTPIVLLIAATQLIPRIDVMLRRKSSHLSQTQVALLDFAKFASVFIGSAVVAAIIGFALDAMGIDPRGHVVGTYVQRNALVVGFAMGFAVIPIIYTIAEDALSTVPEHLRSASLGAGATPWQTATRIIIPTAMSGLFSAVMVGLGRAVGETMIVLMAAGNTPIMEWNIFNGFRTLSANIAVELPEAVRGSTHYRTLFLAALTLFILTFIINTVAEVIRLRFRKRAYQL